MESSEFRIAAESIDRIGLTTTSAELHEQLRCSLALLGYDHILFAMSPSLQRANFDRLVVYQSWPSGWFEQYRELDFHPHDPIANHVRTQLDPFDWRDVPPSNDPIAKVVMVSSALDFGLKEGRCIPIHDHFGYRGAISLAGREPVAATGAADLVAMYAYNRLSRFHLETRKPKLTLRERETVTWVAAGKTSWETGTILNLSEKTVEKHIASAMRKVEAYSRPQLVAECLRSGEIDL